MVSGAERPLVSSSIEEVARVEAGIATSSFSMVSTQPSPALFSDPSGTHSSASRRSEAE